MAEHESKENLSAQCRCGNNLLQELETGRARGRPVAVRRPQCDAPGCGGLARLCARAPVWTKRNRIVLSSEEEAQPREAGRSTPACLMATLWTATQVFTDIITHHAGRSSHQDV